jgi:adenosylcobinamide-GDP ribazoletransferase
MGTLLVGLAVALDWLATPRTVASATIVVGLLALSGALHADGLMDTCDAVFGHASPEQRLEIMRDPRVGAFGVAGFVSVVVLKVAAVDGLPSASRLALIGLAPGLGRWAIVLVAMLFPYARPTGLGAPLKRAATPGALVVASIPVAAACAVIGQGGWLGAAVALLSGVGIGRALLRVLPGLTGDTYGATCELVEAAVWFAGSALLPRLTT